MNRRHLLATCVGSLVALGGCLTADQSPADAETSTEPSTNRQTPTGSEPGVGIEDVATLKAVQYSSGYGSGGVRTDPDRQYVVASITGAPERDPPSFVLDAGGETYQSGLADTRGYTRLAVAGRTRPYLVFPVPSPLSASEPRIRLTEGEGSGWTWPLPADAGAALGAPAPRFELEELTVPDSVTERDQLDISLTVTNISETDGRFLAAAYWPTMTVDDDESHIVAERIPAGESATASLAIDTRATDTSSNPVTLSVEGHVTASREVQVTEYSRSDGGTTATPTELGPAR